MQQIADWLEKLGMSEYAQRFAANDIDFTILGDLTDQDLEKIGVASLGHRRKLLRAIAELNSAPSAAQAAALVTPAPLPAAVVPPPIAVPIAAVECRRTPLSHGYVLRSGGVDQHFRAARCRGVA
jgi:hypothetical protein